MNRNTDRTNHTRVTSFFHSFVASLRQKEASQKRRTVTVCPAQLPEMVLPQQSTEFDARSGNFSFGVTRLPHFLMFARCGARRAPERRNWEGDTTIKELLQADQPVIGDLGVLPSDTNCFRMTKVRPQTVMLTAKVTQRHAASCPEGTDHQDRGKATNSSKKKR